MPRAVSASDLAFLFAAFNLVYALMAVPIGALSDRVGRRPLLFLAYGVFYAANDGVIKAWIVSLMPADRRGRAFGLDAAAGGLLLLPASVIAGALWDASGPRAAFLFSAAVAALALAVVALAPSLWASVVRNGDR